jgi:transposase
MTNGRVEVITSVQRRRRWSSVEKQQLVLASLQPGASVSTIAREAGIHPSQLYGWRRQLRAQPQIGFAPVRIAPKAAQAGLVGTGTIDIEFATGARMRIKLIKSRRQHVSAITLFDGAACALFEGWLGVRIVAQ